jgi:nucleotide-binding universal stress UspA family protein
MTSTDGPVLFAYDGSEHAKAAIREAARHLSDRRHAIVLTVWEPLGAGPLAGAAAMAAPELQTELEHDARSCAGEGARIARESGFDAVPVAWEADPVWRGIVDFADDHDAGIVVLGTHGRTGLPRAVLGSVAETVARHSRRPVLIVNAHAGERAAA